LEWQGNVACVLPRKYISSRSELLGAPNKAYAQENGGNATVLPCITMKTATGEILMGWLASQTDLLADDWGIV
jgi:hypothetical protein